MTGGQGFALHSDTVDDHAAGGCVVDIGHRFRGFAGDALGAAKAVGIADSDRDGLADQGLVEQ
ncbi:hypothetical protein D3C78_1954940 [compost metagenome]